MVNTQIYEFPISVYGKLERYNDTISKCRCRIFYKYGNRNGTYITDEFADQFLSSMAYTPIKGIFLAEEGDYSDHGASRDDGKVYGIVPENYNLKWESHLDEDGISRVYACVDVLLFTALYREAESISTKALSMEIYAQSIRGEWKYVDGRRWYVFDEGKCLALQVLGDAVEPCFEGAAFYTLKNSIESILKEIDKIGEEVNKGGNDSVDQNSVTDEKESLLLAQLNESSENANYSILNVADEYVNVFNAADKKFLKIGYSLNEENKYIFDFDGAVEGNLVFAAQAEKETNDSAVVENSTEDVNSNEPAQEVKAETVPAPEPEKETEEPIFEKIREAAARILDSLDGLDDAYKIFDAYTKQQETAVADLQTAREQVTALTAENEKLQLDLNSLQQKLVECGETLKSQLEVANEVETLRDYKKNVEMEQKKSTLEKYTKLLGEDVISTYSSHLEDFDVLTLDKELAYALVSNSKDLFSKNESVPKVGYVVKEEPSYNGIEEYLERQKHKNNRRNQNG